MNSIEVTIVIGRGDCDDYGGQSIWSLPLLKKGQVGKSNSKFINSVKQRL